ncbi:hypothetical protein N7468_003178 [Penicillium chermesinum]|uniref:Uncharacterized protein n=1 Tax=Penicillium chermesinum TaxID=63820 RepID=A0A9W9P650_9EURO|nr:uncharacterized protein N7468_003178 [Penicillium chermesinum]KAJ5238559.1 hypothetical protein N7468_003178 [Penicillium chermesinum]
MARTAATFRPIFFLLVGDPYGCNVQHIRRRLCLRRLTDFLNLGFAVICKSALFSFVQQLLWHAISAIPRPRTG